MGSNSYIRCMVQVPGDAPQFSQLQEGNKRLAVVVIADGNQTVNGHTIVGNKHAYYCVSTSYAASNRVIIYLSGNFFDGSCGGFMGRYGGAVDIEVSRINLLVIYELALQGDENVGQDVEVAQLGKAGIDGYLRATLFRQPAPRAAIEEHIEDGLNDQAVADSVSSPGGFFAWQQVLDFGPFFVGKFVESGGRFGSACGHKLTTYCSNVQVFCQFAKCFQTDSKVIHSKYIYQTIQIV